MREQYDKEMAEVHASPELIRRTKAAMRQEEERIHKQKEAEKGHGFRARIWMLATAAAVVLVLALAPRLVHFREEIPETEMPVRAGREELSETLIPRTDSEDGGSLAEILEEYLQKIKEMLTEENSSGGMKE